MLAILYAIGIAFKAFGLPWLCVLSTAIDWHMARCLSLCMAGNMGRDKFSATTLRNGQLALRAYLDEVLLLFVAPCLLSPSARKLSLPGSRMSIMSCIEICASPIQDDGGASLVKGSLEDAQNDDTAGYVSDESISQDADTAFEADVDGEGEDTDGFEYRRSSTFDNQRFEIGYRAPLIPQKTLPDLPPIPANRLTRKVPPLKRVLSRVFLESGVDAKSSASMANIFSKAQHELTHKFIRRDSIHLWDTHGESSSSSDGSSPEVSPSPSPTNFSRLPGTVTVTDVFEHPTHTVTRTVIRPSPNHFFFSLPFKRSSLSSVSKSGSRSSTRTPEPIPVPDAHSSFEEELDAYEQRWEDEKGGHNAMDIYVVVDRDASYEESWRSLVQELHYSHLSPSRNLSSECGRW